MSGQQNSLMDLRHCTLAQLIEAGNEYLEQHQLVYGHGTDNPFDESAWLALEACGLSPAVPLDDYDIPVASDQLKRARSWFKKRAIDNIPVAYLTGRSWFAGHEFITDERALIPRSPIAELIALGFEPWLSEPPGSVLDLCCGGGCIAIATALEFPQAQVHGCDLSAGALELAKLNRHNHQLGKRLQFFQGDLFEALPENARYDLILSNPPYVDLQDMRSLPAEFKHEPQMGLAAGNDGLDIVDRMLSKAKQRLTPSGVMIVEVGNSQPAVEKRFADLDLVWLDFQYGGQGVFLVAADSL